MIHELFQNYFYNDTITVKNKKNMLLHADRIIAISENTKGDILRLYPEIDHEKIAVVYHGISYNILNNNEKKESYLLYTGQREGYKNFDTFIRAVAPLLLQYDLQLICTGKSFESSERMIIDDLHITERAICKFVPDTELLGLCSKAVAFVFPSLYEGFGFPVLEAFVSGCPAILANTSSLPEIGGNAALYFDPYSIEDMRSAIEKVISSPSLQSELIDRGREQVKKYSWKTCAAKTAKIYKTLENK
jgi:glycosyltransferase involved in cell wall biosynthesis